MQNNTLPTLADLQKDPQNAYEQSSLNWILNQDPPANFIQYHPTVKVKNELGAMVPLPYLPVDKVEYLMTMIFKRWEVTNLKVFALFNSVCATLTVKYWLPDGSIGYQDGGGAMPVQTNAGASAADLSQIKAAAIQMAAPGAASYAFKDACERIGRIFGKDLGRKHVLNFEAFAPAEVPEQTTKRTRTAKAPEQVTGPAAPPDMRMPDLQPTGAPQLQGYQTLPAGIGKTEPAAYNPQPLPMSQFQAYADTVPHPDPAQQWPKHPANQPNSTYNEADAAAAHYQQQAAAARAQAYPQATPPPFEAPTIKF